MCPFRDKPDSGYACAAPKRLCTEGMGSWWGLVLSPLTIVLGAQDAQRTEHASGPIWKAASFFSHIYPISLSANAIEGSCCIIHVVSSVFTTNSSPAVCRTHNCETHNRRLLQTSALLLLGSCWIASRVLEPTASDHNPPRLS